MSSREIDATDSTEPAMSRPIGWSGHKRSSSIIETRAPGESKEARISSYTTCFSFAMSSSLNRELRVMSDNRSIPSR